MNASQKQPTPSTAQLPHIEVAQNERAQAEVPQCEVAESEPHEQAFFRLAHSTFGDPRISSLPGDALKIYLWMPCQAWRFPDSNGTLRAAMSYASKGCGSSKATVSRCFLVLQSVGLISVLETNYKIGNLWLVSDLAASRPGKRRPQLCKPELSQVEVPQIEAEATSI